MGRRLGAVLVCVLACPALASAQAPPEDGVTHLLARLQALLQTGSSAGFASLFSGDFPSDEIEPFAEGLFTPEARRAVVAERDRMPLTGVLPGDGYRVIAELFTESAQHARIVTVAFDMRRPTGGQADSWRIVDAAAKTSIEGLYRLRLNESAHSVARNLTIASEDLRITLIEGSVFPIDSAAGTTGFILFGRGVMRFSPTPEAERGQLRIFAGAETLEAPFTSAFVRLNPLEYDDRVSAASLTPAAAAPRDVRRARDLLARSGPQFFSLDLHDLSSEPWYFLPPSGDFLAEVQTRRHGVLTYSKSGTLTEDITLYERDSSRTIALYPSAARRGPHDLFVGDDDLRDYDVLDYDIEASISPEREFLEGHVRMRIRVRAEGLAALTLRLSDDLVVSSVASLEYGRLLFLRVREQSNVIVNFPLMLPGNTELSLLVSYAGRVTPQDIDDEGLQAGDAEAREDPFAIPLEPNVLLSSRSYWYPQNPFPDYATGTLRIIVPEGYGCVASGQPRTGTEVSIRDLLRLTDGRSFVFTASDPVRYFAVVVSRFVRVAETTLTVGATGGDRPGGSAIRLAIEANPRQQGRGRALLPDVEAVLRFYAGIVGEAPYGSMTLAMVEHELPGGHSPGYFAVLNNPIGPPRLSWRSDPAAFPAFPEFFVAHEIAHQWWGHAVGWRSYHDQWLSEGFAQYFAALYAQQIRGERTFVEMLRQFRRWAISESPQGPISLGSRLGHIRRQPRVFRALVYNKGAAVLHMLRRLIGEDAFFNGLRRFYTEQKFQSASTGDLRAVFELESGRPLERFFDTWIYGIGVPRLRYSSVIAPGTVTVRFEQLGDTFDIPVTVTLVYTDGRVQDTVVPVTETRVEWTVRPEGTVKQVQVNRDFAAVAVFERS